MISRMLVAVFVLQNLVIAVPVAQAIAPSGTVVSPMVVGGVDGYHFVSLKSDGTVWTWGMNSDGQIGDNTTGTINNRNAPTQVHGPGNVGFLTGVKSVAAGSFHSLALKTDGTVWTWGRGNEGEMGDGSTSDSNTPVQVSGLTDVVAIAGGGYHSIALKSDGTVWGWGGNWAGQLGDNSQTQRTTPVQMHDIGGAGTVSDVKMIATGAYHTLVLKTDGTMYATGWNNQGSLGDGTTTERDFLVAVDNTNLNSDVKFIAGGLETSFAVLSDGTAWAWGYNDYGQVGDSTIVDKSVPTQVHGVGDVGFLTGVISIGGGEYFSSALLDDGTVVAWGENGSGQHGTGTATAPVLYPEAAGSGLTNVTVAAMAGYNVAALKTDGTIKTWGFTIDGEAGDGVTPAPPYYTAVPVTASINLLSNNGEGAIAVAGGHHSMALKANGTVWAWGRNDYGQLGDGTTVERHSPVQVSGLSGVRAIAASFYHSMALKANGTVWAWGENLEGELGDGTLVQRHSPVQVAGLSGVIAIAMGDHHSSALKSDGTVWSWGYNNEGQLGDGNAPTNSSSPVQVSGLTNVIDISSKGRYTIALKSDGTVWSWGYNNSGELGNGTSPTSSDTPVQVTGLTDIIGIVGGGFHALAIKSGGTVWDWGSNASGQLGNGTSGPDIDTPVQVSGLTDVVSLGGGYDHNTALKSDGTLWAWGYGGDGELGNGANVDSDTPVQVDDTNIGSNPKSVAVGTGGQSIVITNDGNIWTWGANWYGQLGDNSTTDSNVPIGSLFIVIPPTPNTVNNRVELSREAVNATATATIYFTLNDTLSSQLNVTFDPAFTGMDVSGASATTPSTPGCMSNFQTTGANSFSADKSGCTGSVVITGVTVINPPTPGPYLVSWVNDDDGYAMVAIVDSDQVTVNANVSPTITFDLDTGVAAGETAAPYSVALGALTVGAVNHSDNSGINSIFAQLDTNATGGAQVTVLSANAALKSASVPADTIPNAAAAMAAGTANYGICVNTVTAPSAATGTFQPSAPYNAGTCSPAGSTNDVKTLSSVSPTNILDSNSAPLTSGSAEILVNAAIDTSTVAHSDYSDTLTFVATGTF